MFFLSWVLYPLVLAAVCLGCALLVDRLSGSAIPRALLLPTGLAVVVIVATALTYFDVTSELAAPALVATAVSGFALAAGRRAAAGRTRKWMWPVLAAALPFLAVAAPVLMTGAPGLTGYARIVDLAFQLDMAAHLVEYGRSAAGADGISSHDEVTRRIVGSGYPGGAQAALAATAQLTGIDPIWAWQPFLAWTAAMLGLALYALLGVSIASPAARAVAAGVAAQPTILYSYTLASGIKEIAAAQFVALTAALLAARVEGTLARSAVPLATAIGAGLCAVNVGILPWVLVMLAVMLGPALRDRVGSQHGFRPAALRRWWPAAVAGALVLAPVAVATVELAPLLRAGGPRDLGNLTEPVPIWSTLGPWLTSDYRYPLDVMGTETVTVIFALLVAALAAVGFAHARRTNRALFAAGLAAIISVAVVVWRGSDWVELKAFAVSAPLLVALAFGGAAALRGDGWRRWAAPAAGVVVAGSVLAGNALVYRSTPLAPHERLAELEDLGERYADQGPALHPSHDEYAGYLMRDAGLVHLLDVPDDARGGRSAARANRFVEDLDRIDARYVSRFKLIVMRRGDPAGSRPPADWQLVQRSKYYDVFRRRGAPAVVAHLPQAQVATARSDGFCRSLADALTRAGSGAQVAYAPAVDAIQFQADPQANPKGWLVHGPDRLARGPGRLVLIGAVAEAGRYDVWIRGSFGRRVSVAIDGRQVGSVRWRENYPLQYEPAGAIRLAAGGHKIEIVRGGGTLLPGTGNEIGPEGITTRIGPVALFPSRSRHAVHIVDRREGLRVCGATRRLDWIAIVRRDAPARS